jgi:hypothetical protein
MCDICGDADWDNPISTEGIPFQHCYTLGRTRVHEASFEYPKGVYRVCDLCSVSLYADTPISSEGKVFKAIVAPVTEANGAASVTGATDVKIFEDGFYVFDMVGNGIYFVVVDE